ncbi:acyl-CoA dehydrogenase family protein [Limnohabitans sp. 2KL-51]|jgi:acyl-CoA dehydrogenase|uniref:acyl-CoA dehydrogenase family protein n=1 Tax=Limnohabitans sp. 2KL-51 TaxID=1977911 RepID=UPI000D39DC13|nr:acyl-CoA dehydrogenase family protein [Limnohabitans sp. 2KL-51]PUE51134.1 acyl-CoA dehydrogenase [Limnohabitans sp. 2KL-51]
MSQAAPDLSAVSMDLGEDYPEIRASVRRICADFPGSYWRDLDEKEAYPSDFVQAMTDAGFLSALIPEEYGGAGLPLRAAGVVLEEIHACGGNAGATHAQMYTMGTVLRHGSAAQKSLYLPQIASGALRLQAFGVTEPTSGTDTTKLKTRAVREGDEYVINGQKIWTSRALYSDLMLLLARTTPLEDVKKKSEGLSVFLVDMRKAVGNGMTIRPIKAMINHNTTEVFFDNLRIPADSLIGQEGQGLRCIMDGMNAERILVAHESIGDAKWFIKTAVKYANERVIFDRPIGKNQGIQFPIAKAYAQTQAAELMLRKSAAVYEANQPCGEYANLTKLLTAEAAWEAGEACMQTHGGFAYAREYDIERKWREARVQRTAPISTNLILSYIAEHVLGLPRSY